MLFLLFAWLGLTEPGTAAPVAVPVEPRITSPRWVRKPSKDEITSALPRAAAAHGVTGKVIMECSVTADGRLRDCTATKESPAGWGFGDAAIGLASIFRMRPTTAEGHSVEGAKVHMRLQLDSPVRVEVNCAKKDNRPDDCRVISANPPRHLEAVRFWALGSARTSSFADARRDGRGRYAWTVEIEAPFEECPSVEGGPSCTP